MREPFWDRDDNDNCSDVPALIGINKIKQLTARAKRMAPAKRSHLFCPRVGRVSLFLVMIASLQRFQRASPYVPCIFKYPDGPTITILNIIIFANKKFYISAAIPSFIIN
jgi:hypothetical protein